MAQKLNYILILVIVLVTGLYFHEFKKVECPLGQELLGGECFTPYVYYCDNKKIDARTNKEI